MAGEGLIHPVRKKLVGSISKREDGSLILETPQSFLSVVMKELAIIAVLSVMILTFVAIALFASSSTAHAEATNALDIRGPKEINQPLVRDRDYRTAMAAVFPDYVNSPPVADTAMLWPVSGVLTDGFGVRQNPFSGKQFEFHKGQDISAPKGTSVVAVAEGTVKLARWMGGYGQAVIIEHGNGISTRYGHLSKIEVVAGQTIKRGEEIGQVGSTGRSTGPHLHFEVRVSEQAVDPTEYVRNLGNQAVQ
jgi:murein DD-endopeptidase MepM/ murein hydrolase activator NlpD